MKWLRSFSVAIGILALVVMLTACASSSVSTKGRAGNAQDPYLTTPNYAKLNDGRVLRCIATNAYGGDSVYNCDWNHPVTGHDSDAETSNQVNIKVEDKTYLCLSFSTYGGDRVFDCDWDNPVSSSSSR